MSADLFRQDLADAEAELARAHKALQVATHEWISLRTMKHEHWYLVAQWYGRALAMRDSIRMKATRPVRGPLDVEVGQ